MPTKSGFITIACHSINKTQIESVIMIPITEKEEQELDNGVLHYVRENIDIVIDSKSKPIYGEIDFHTNSDDYKVLETMDWLDYITLCGIHVPANYNYEEHCCYSPIRRYKTYDTVNPAVVAQYKHAFIGKPQRVCIFKLKRYGHKYS